MSELTDKKKITIMIAIITAMFFSAINQTIIGVAMPRIIAKLGGMDYYSWAITIYLLTSTVASVLVGKLSDIYGRKPFLLAGIGLFSIGALLSGFSGTIFQLITYRAIQGAGAGIIMSTAFTAMGDLYEPRERAKWTGVMSAVFGVSSVAGPLLGGYIVDHLDWHWVFWIFLPIGVIAFTLILLHFPRVEKRQGESVDYFGSLFLTTTIVPMLLAFSWAGDGPNKYAWGSWQIISLLAVTVVSLGIFLWTETKVKTPVLPLGLFKNSVFTVSNLVGFFLNAGMMGAIIYVPFFVQGVKGISPTMAKLRRHADVDCHARDLGTRRSIDDEDRQVQKNGDQRTARHDSRDGADVLHGAKHPDLFARPVHDHSRTGHGDRHASILPDGAKCRRSERAWGRDRHFPAVPQPRRYDRDCSHGQRHERQHDHENDPALRWNGAGRRDAERSGLGREAGAV